MPPAFHVPLASTGTTHVMIIRSDWTQEWLRGCSLTPPLTAEQRACYGSSERVRWARPMLSSRATPSRSANSALPP
jgi:hypothetical protein